MILDTNALLWLFEDSPLLGPQARGRIEASKVWFSAVSVTEVTIKAAIGKLPSGDVEQAALRAGLAELPLTATHGAAIALFPTLVRHDPFDRMLLAQAQVEAMPLLTSDATLLAAAPELTLDARS
ncbi:PIN domain nuclease of toxin-antitoxin system [Knoellia remsis]|uniref:PIN domain nuclease of toxin-antitoxin system n=1 Tax=Knoellia remsis TaxID=407159 RepID=A0A2T0UQC5_9MICO|nr:type II toxin-antitoxin system VapC family toxin [Knoellia remsis]PRY60104.1 PIN domain nuclease of toxin-antitoxin system [Knoellia remsis]